MRPLIDVKPTDQQLSIVSKNRPGVEIIRGAAGSGKTTTALLRLRSLVGMFLSRRAREESTMPVRVLILTFNRTLRGYIDELAKQQVKGNPLVKLEIATFASWATRQLGRPPIISDAQRQKAIQTFGAGLGLQADFLQEEVDYLLGRFLPQDLDKYITLRRDGRGATPRMDKALRELLIQQVIIPYQAWLNQDPVKWDWNDLAAQLSGREPKSRYDIIIVDEAQDFSANQLRAIKNHLAEPSSLTFIVDTAQRIYARGYTWAETGIIVRPENVARLEQNHRNTVEIARFAASILMGLPLDDDATMPDFTKTVRHGKVPTIIKGKYNKQFAYVLKYIRNKVNLEKESVAILQPYATGNWFTHAREELSKAKLAYIEITKESDWPTGDGNIALSTLHSAKGLEFDHVMLLGINAEVMPHGDDKEDDRRSMLRRLLAMGISRARLSVILGYKPEDASDLIAEFDPATYEEVTL